MIPTFKNSRYRQYRRLSRRFSEWLNDAARSMNERTFAKMKTTLRAIFVSICLIIAAISIGKIATASGSWTTKAPMPEAREQSASAVSGGLLYIFGGSLSTVPLVYDPVSDSWSTRAPDSAARCDMATITYNGKIHVIGGWINCDFNSPTTIHRAYDPVTDTWSDAASTLVARGETAFGLIGGKFYLTGGGASFPGAFNQTEIYDPVTDSWSFGAPIPIAVRKPGSAVIGGKLYVVSGQDASNVFRSEVQIYDPVSNSWSFGAAIPTPRKSPLVGVIGGKLYAATGYNGSELTTLEIYDIASNSWTMGPSSTTPRWLGVGEVIDSNFYIAEGRTAGGDTSSLEVFTPESTGPDQDGDGIADDVDNCPNNFNPDQTDSDGDGVGDLCDTCATDPNKVSPGECGCRVADTDSDHDGTPDCFDPCSSDPTKTSPGLCGCGIPDTDTDDDGRADCDDACPNDRDKIAPGACGCGIPDTDTDGDGVPNCHDNCPTTFNPDQRDSNNDGVGDACTTVQPPNGGMFVIGDRVNIATGATIYFWGSQWAQNNPMSGGAAPNSFKGFENGSPQTTCGASWASQPGNSSSPPASLPQYMAVIVSSSIQKNGSIINGNVSKIVIVKTKPGYGPAPGHAGIGEVVSTYCPASISANMLEPFPGAPAEPGTVAGLEWLSNAARRWPLGS